MEKRLSTDRNIVPSTESVETQKQYDELSRMGCKLFQGFFTKPMAVSDFEAQYIGTA